MEFTIKLTCMLLLGFGVVACDDSAILNEGPARRKQILPSVFAFSEARIDCSNKSSDKLLLEYYGKYMYISSQDHELLDISDDDIVIYQNSVQFYVAGERILEYGWDDSLSLCGNYDRVINGEGVAYDPKDYILPSGVDKSGEKYYSEPSRIWFSQMKMLQLKLFKGETEVTDCYCIKGQLEGAECPIYSTKDHRSVLLPRYSSIDDLMAMAPLFPGALRLALMKDVPEPVKAMEVTAYIEVELPDGQVRKESLKPIRRKEYTPKPSSGSNGGI